MAHTMSETEKLNAIRHLPRIRATFRKLPKEHRVRVIEVIDVVTAENLKAVIEAVKKGN